jgi:3-hydroxyacyl-CoA dehydrogenase
MVRVERDGSVLIVISNNPPVNALGLAVREGLIRAIRAAEADTNVDVIILACEGRTFHAGADIAEFDTGVVAPGLPEVCDTIEACSKPVLAAIHGTALGGGLEVAMSAHYRVAVPSAKLGLPEVKLGILPGAGGTQRLPRLVGVSLALEMATSGTPISATRGFDVGLVDHLAGEGRLLSDAIAIAQQIAAARPLPRTRDKVATGGSEVVTAFQNATARKFRAIDAPKAVIEAIAASMTLPFDEGQALEQKLFAQLVAGDQSKAQRHVFFAERRAAKIDDIPADTKALAIGRVGVIGAGTMGGGISMSFLSAGIPVTLVEQSQDALDRGVATIRLNYEATAAKGRLTSEQVEVAIALLTVTTDFAALADADLVIEAVFERMDIKKEIFARLDKIAKPTAILASNTSYLDIDEIAAATSRPASVIGLHFFSPANVMKLLEVVRGEKTGPAALATAMALAKKIGKVAVVSRVCFGFIGNRMLEPRQVEAVKLLLEGATPAQIDKVVTDFGLPMGPFQMADLAGVDIGWHRDPAQRNTIQEILCAQGRWGQKTAKGYYDYDAKRKPAPSSEVEALVRDLAERNGIGQRMISDEEIFDRCIMTMVNEGMKILEEGVAQRASDIDIVWINGYGWPVWRGGPMFWAETIGFDTILEHLQAHSDRLGENAAPAALLVEKATIARREA